MLEALHIPLEHIAGAWRTGHSEALVLHHERLFKSMDDRGVHADFDDECRGFVQLPGWKGGLFVGVARPVQR